MLEQRELFQQIGLGSFLGLTMRVTIKPAMLLYLNGLNSIRAPRTRTTAGDDGALHARRRRRLHRDRRPRHGTAPRRARREQLGSRRFPSGSRPGRGRCGPSPGNSPTVLWFRCSPIRKAAPAAPVPFESFCAARHELAPEERRRSRFRCSRSAWSCGESLRNLREAISRQPAFVLVRVELPRCLQRDRPDRKPAWSSAASPESQVPKSPSGYLTFVW